MALNPISEVQQLRNQGMIDNDIVEQLMRRGYSPEQIHAAISQLDSYAPQYPQQSAYPQPASRGSSSSLSAPDDAIYDRMQELIEKSIDEKWDELISEVKKIIEWKEKIEEKQNKIEFDMQKIKEDFNLLHQGVLGKLEDYDTRVQDVNTELKAIGKVFKDVIPTFVENVKELSSITGKIREK
ncbi:hypothetical protein HYX11_04010 [Candidatus Woesearchaeota archaeon]|nr:hypothetical protein [Candidatus Woesearchaeota archaeon]